MDTMEEGICVINVFLLKSKDWQNFLPAPEMRIKALENVN